MSLFSPIASVGLVRRVPSGTLRTGSRFHAREQPRRSVLVREFEMAHAAVTVNQFGAFVAAGGYAQAQWWPAEGNAWRLGQARGWGRAERSQPDAWPRQCQRPHHPVVGVTWFEAAAYCAWLSAQVGLVVRLPAEDEWERAARGDDGRPFPWGEVFDPALTNTLESGLHDTQPAASLSGDSSPFGLLEMAGNVQEWTSGAYQPAADQAEAAPPAQALYCARGGSFNDTAFGARTSYRRAYPPGYFYPFLGFRVVVARV